MTTKDDRPVRLVTDGEPPFDPDYDRPTDTRQAPHDRAAERAVLGALLADPTLGTNLHPHLDADDFYFPVHGQFWDAWHHLATTTDTPPDYVTLNAHLVTQARGDLVRLIPDLLHACPNPVAAETYARIVRDHARLRVVDDLATGLHQIATKGKADQVDTYLGEALQRLDDTVTRFGPRTTTHNTGLHDLTWVLTGTPPTQDPPTYCVRTDGHALFYAGKVNGVFGDPECGKTWLAQTAVVEALTAGGTAAMIDVDHNGANHTAARLLLLGARFEHIADPTRFRYYEPEDADQLRAAVTDITTWAPDVYLLDSLGEVLPMLGVKSVDNDEITTALRTVCTPPATAGSCVITIDHLPKSAEARVTGYAIGGTAKKRIMRGSYIRAEARTQPAPGQIGRITLRIEKDTVGELRKVTPGGYAGTFVLDSTAEHITRFEITRDDSPVDAQGKFRPTGVMEQVSRFIEDNDQCKFTEIKLGVTAQDKTIRTAIKLLVDEGFVSVIKGTKTHSHHSTALYREAEDDHL